MVQKGILVQLVTKAQRDWRVCNVHLKMILLDCSLYSFICKDMEILLCYLGVTGTKGIAGTKGEPGTDGIPGTDGTDGTKGQKGEKAATAVDGKCLIFCMELYRFEGQA